MLDKAVRKREVPPATLNDLKVALSEEWQNLPQICINRLIESVPRRIKSVIKAHGGSTRY